MKEAIIKFLQGTELDFFEALRLYASASRKLNVLRSFEMRPNWHVNHHKIIFELENIAGVPHSNRLAVVKPAQQFTHAETAKLINSLPKLAAKPEQEPDRETKEKIILKGVFYTRREVLRKKLRDAGTKNDKLSIQERAHIVSEIQALTQTIVILSDDIRKEIPEAEEVPEEYDFSFTKNLTDVELKDLRAKTLEKIADAKKTIEKTKSETVRAKNEEKLKYNNALINHLNKNKK